MIPVLLTVKYEGSLLTDVLTTSSWDCVHMQVQGHGALPVRPQFHLDVLTSKNIDGARYRIGGSHFPTFRMTTIVAVQDFKSAQIVARDMESIKGEKVRLSSVEVDGFDSLCWVIDVISQASPKRVVNASPIVVPGIETIS